MSIARRGSNPGLCQDSLHLHSVISAGHHHASAPANLCCLPPGACGGQGLVCCGQHGVSRAWHLLGSQRIFLEQRNSRQCLIRSPLAFPKSSPKLLGLSYSKSCSFLARKLPWAWTASHGSCPSLARDLGPAHLFSSWAPSSFPPPCLQPIGKQAGCYPCAVHLSRVSLPRWIFSFLKSGPWSVFFTTCELEQNR